MSEVSFVVADETGRIYRAGTCDESILEAQKDEPDHVVLVGEGEPRTHYVTNGQIVAFTPEQRALRDVRPPYPARWDNTLMAWVDLFDVDSARSSLIARLATKRDTLLEGGFTWSDRIVQSDMAVSQTRLLGLFTTDLAGGIPAEGLGWKFANGWKTLYPGDGIAIWAAFQAFMQSLFVAFKAHEDAVKAETDIEVLRSYDTEAGWTV